MIEFHPRYAHFGGLVRSHYIKGHNSKDEADVRSRGSGGASLRCGKVSTGVASAHSRRRQSYAGINGGGERVYECAYA